MYNLFVSAGRITLSSIKYGCKWVKYFQGYRSFYRKYWIIILLLLIVHIQYSINDTKWVKPARKQNFANEKGFELKGSLIFLCWKVALAGVKCLCQPVNFKLKEVSGRSSLSRDSSAIFRKNRYFNAMWMLELLKKWNCHILETTQKNLVSSFSPPFSIYWSSTKLVLKLA